MGFLEQLKAFTEPVDRRLAELLPPVSSRPSDLHSAMRYSCLAPGKRLRPALCMACAEAVGSDPASVLDAACAVEMVHCFSLIHDDLPAIDNDDLRRGMPTCHRQFTEALAILAGDALFALANETLANGGWDAEARLAAVSLLSAAAGSDGLVGGEVEDVLSEGKQVDRETVEFIHSRKTGALMAASCGIGARLGGGSPDQVQRLFSYGQELGLAFQIADDLLNELSTAEMLGKAAGSDRERAKATYTAIHGVAGAQRLAAEAIDLALQNLSGLKGGTSFLRDLALFAIERNA